MPLGGRWNADVTILYAQRIYIYFVTNNSSKTAMKYGMLKKGDMTAQLKGISGYHSRADILV